MCLGLRRAFWPFSGFGAWIKFEVNLAKKLH